MRKFINLVALAALLFVPWVANAQATLPQSMDFESGLGSWTTASTHSSSGVTSETAHNGSSSFRFYYSTNPPQYLISPELEVLAVQLQVEFWYKAHSDYYTESFQVGYSTTTNATDSFTWGTEISTNNTNWQQYSDFVPAGTKYVAIKYTANDQFYLFIDDIFVGEPPTCFPVTSLTATYPTSDGITLNWIDTINSGATYTVFYWKNGGDTTSVSGISGSATTLTNLDAASEYHYYVVSNCSATDNSIPSQVSTFWTDCMNGSCEITVTSTSGYNYSNYCPTLGVYQNGGLVTSVNAATEQVRVCSGDTVIVLYTAPTYTWYSPAATIRDGGDVELFNGSTSTFSTGDTLSVIAVPCPSCLPPVALTAIPDSNQIEFSWSPRSGAGQFVVYLNDSVVNDNVIDTFYTFTDLPANTAFTVRVQSVCTSDDSSSIASLNTRTACGQIVLPYFVDFEDVEYNGAWYPCWDSAIHAGTDPSVNTVAQHNSTYGMYFQASSSEPYNLVVSPMVPTAGNNIYVRFWGYNTNTEWFRAGVMSNPHDTSTFIPLVDIVGSTWNEYEFRTDTATGIDPTATYYVAWMAYQPGVYYNTQMGRVDDVLISEAPSCERPANAYYTDLTAHTVTLFWDGVPGVNSYNVYYGTVNDPTSSSLTVVPVNDTTTTLTDLNGETQYYAWVTANCGSAESDYRPFGGFNTPISCPAVTNLTIDTTTTEGATIHWTAGGEETQWWVMVDSTEMGLVYDTTITVNSLDPMTGHTLYVRGICGDGDTAAARNINFATRCDAPICNLTAYVTDQYNDSWNGCTINIMQAGVQVGTIDCPNGQSGSTFTYEVCSSAAVELVFNKGNYASEMGGYIQDGGGNTIFTISGMSSHNTGDVLATVATPCPSCIMPMHIALDSATLTATSATITWDRGEGSAWIVRIDSTEDNTSDNFYTFNDLEARTEYTVYVATDCDGDTSSFNSFTFRTDCTTGSCNITVSAVSGYSYGTYYSPTVHVYQNGVEEASVTEATETVSVCSSMPITFIYGEPSYTYDYYPPHVTITDGGGDVIFDEGTSNYNTSDTLITIDNACPSCLTPTGVMATSIDSTEISFAWNTIDTVSAYLISLNGQNETYGTFGNETYLFLTPNTEYTFSVRAVCAPGDTSAARTITVRTACSSMILPFTEDFESGTVGDVPTCWNIISGSPEIDGIAANAHSGSKSLEMGGSNDMIASGRVPLAGDSIHVSCWINHSSGILEAGVMTNPSFDTTFIPLVTSNGTNDVYTLLEFNTNSLPHDSIYYVAFRYNAPWNYIYIDDINIRQDDGCLYPSDLVATPSSNSVDLSWNNNGLSSGFAVEYRSVNGTWSAPDIVIGTTANITGLNASTNYEVRVGNLCGNDTLWTNATFQTLCGLMTVPYFEDFDSYADDVMPPCWEWSSTFATHWDGGIFLKSYHGGGSEYVVVPQLNGNITKLKIEFDTKVGTPAENDGIMIGVTDATGTLISWLDTLQDPNFSRNNHVHKTVYFTNYVIPGNAARVAFAQLRNWGEWALIDNISIEELPSCYPIDNLVGHNLNDPEATYFTWHPMGEEAQWQVYVDTVTVGIEDLANISDSNFITVTDTTYIIPIGMIQGGGIYNFFVRANCGTEQSGWVKNEFGAGTIIMNNSTVADTVVGCGFVVYDNGGPIAGYLAPSNSALVIRTENVGSQLQLFGGKFGFGSSAATLNIYDGEGTNGNLIYTYNTIDGRDTILDSVMAVTTTGSMTITFSVTGNMAHTGYELYIRCTDGAICPRPTELQAHLTSETTADVTWTSDATDFNFYYRISGSPTWVRIPTTSNNVSLTGLVSDTVYDMYVVAICSPTDSSTASVVRQLNTTQTVSCNVPTNLIIGSITDNSAVVSWTGHGESAWHISVNGAVSEITTNPYTLTGLHASSNYTVKVQAICDSSHASGWSNTVIFSTPAPGMVNYTVTVNVNDATMGSVTGDGVYTSGDTVTITATPNTGYRFVNWNTCLTATSFTFVIGNDTTFTANFELIPTYTVAVSANVDSMGTVSGAGTYYEGTVITISATPNEGYHFVNWNTGDSISTFSLTVTSDTAFVANFEENVSGLQYYTVTANVNDSVMGSVTGNIGTYVENTPITLTAVANSGYRFVSWDNGATTATISFTLTADTTVTATFEAIPTFTVTAVANDITMGTVTGGGSYTEGSTVTLTAMPNNGYEFLNWSNGATTTSIDIVVVSDTTLTAFFQEIVIPCEIPGNPIYSNVTDNSATLSWTSNASQWELGVTRAGANENTVTANTNPYTLNGLEANTTYTVRVRAICTDGVSNWSTTVTFTTNNVGIADINASTISLYPNPASATVTLTGIEGATKVTLVDLNGRTAGEWTVKNGELTIDVTDLAQGAYFVRIVGEQMNAIRKLIVK